MKIDVRRFLALGLLATIIGGPLTACSGATKTTAAAGLDDSIHALAAGGIAVVDDVDARTPISALSGPASAMVFTRWQVQNVVAEANAHNGYLGRELDALAAPPAGGPSFSGMLAAWLAKPNGALATYAARFMAGQDMNAPATTVFPTIVVLTFIGDIARPTPAISLVRPRTFEWERLIASPAEADGVCSVVSNFVSTIVSNVASAIQANGSSWLSTVWNELVTAGAVAATVIAGNVVKPMLAFITHIATVCATIMQVSSMFKPWTVALAGNPAAMTLSDSPQQGTFVATLSAEDIKWPAKLVDCVNSLTPNADLSDASYKDAPVKWTQPIGIPGFATKLSEDDTLAASRTATYAYATTTVPVVPANLCPTLGGNDKVGITVTVERSDVTKTLQTLESLITEALPQALQTILQPYITDALSTANDKAAEFRSPHQSIVVPLRQYVPDPVPNCATPLPAPSPSPNNTPANQSGSMPFVPCAQLLTAADTEPYLGGAHLMPKSKAGDELTSGMAALTAINGPQAETYDHTRSTFCIIGTGTMPNASQQSDSNGEAVAAPASDFKFAALFYTVPRGSEAMPEMTPLPASAAADPTSCTAIIGIATLNRLHAQCVVDSDVSVMVDDPEAEYMFQGAPAGAGAEFITLSPGSVQRAMAHILQRL